MKNSINVRLGVIQIRLDKVVSKSSLTWMHAFVFGSLPNILYLHAVGIFMRWSIICICGNLFGFLGLAISDCGFVKQHQISAQGPGRGAGFSI